MKKIKVMIGLAVMMLMVAACSEDSTNDRGLTTVEQMFQQIKASYIGSYVSTNNVPKAIHITIDKQANVVVDQFPLDLVFAKLYPDDYTAISELEGALRLEAPIKGFNLDAKFIEFSTNTDQTAPLEFTFKKNGVEHKGWALVYVIGLYDQQLIAMTMQLSVVDLVIDGEDMRQQTPIHYFVDGAIKDTSDQ